MSTSCGLCQGASAPIPAPGKWKADAKLSLLPTLLDALPAPKATGRPSANASVMWRFFTTSVYKSGDLPVLATREALQNSFDAIRAALRARQITHGHFEVEWKEEERSLSWSDNGIGMDTATILDKFLTIGESGKAGAADSGEAAGGFGVAKAVILGASRSFRWELHTRNNLAVGNGANADVEIFEAPPRQGTRITIYDVSPEFSRWYDYARQAWVDLPDRLRELLGANDLDRVTLRLNGEEIRPLFSRRGGSRVKVDESWGPGSTTSIKAYRRAPGDKQGAYYLRLNGLFQVKEPSQRSGMKVDVVVDLHSSVRPGQRGYPFNAARDALQEHAHAAFNALVDEVEKENESIGLDDAEEVYDPDGDELPEGAGELEQLAADAFADPEMQAALAQAAGGITAFYAEMLKNPGREQEITSVAPAGSPVRAGEEAEPRGPIFPTGYFSAAELEEMAKKGRAPMAPDLAAQTGGAIRVFLAQAEREGEQRLLDTTVTEAIGEVESGEAGVQTVQILDSAIERATEAAMKPGGGGLMQAAMAPALRKALEQATGKKLPPRNPFGRMAGLRIHKKNYDRAKARRFKQSYGRWLPHLVVWDSTLRLIATEVRIQKKFKPGFVLDDSVLGLTARGPRGSVVYLQPDRFAQVVRAHRDRPLAIAGYLHGIACHELTHLDSGRLHANGHDERFVVGREDLGISTAHLLPVIAALATSVLKLPAPVERKQREKLERDLELARQQSQALRERQRVAEKESAALRTRLAELEQGIRQTPGLPGQKWESLKGWLETLEILERPPSRPGGTRRYTAELVSGHWRALPEWMVAAAGTGEIRSLEAALARAPEEVQAPLRSAIQRARRRCAAPGAEMLLERIGHAMRRAAPELGVPVGYVEGFLRRNRPGMLGALQRGVGA